MICLLRDYRENEMECFFVFVEGPDDERFITSVLGVKIGSIFGYKYKSKAELLGGCILILLGLKLFV